MEKDLIVDKVEKVIVLSSQAKCLGELLQEKMEEIRSLKINPGEAIAYVYEIKQDMDRYEMLTTMLLEKLDGIHEESIRAEDMLLKD